MKRYMSELWDALRLGHSGGEGKRGGTKDPSPAWSEQRRRRDVGAGVGASKLNPITKSLTLEKFSSKMSLEIEMHECTDAQNPMLARTFDGMGANLLSD